METVINDYISREFVPDAALLPLANDTSLLNSGILDSLSLLRLVVFLEERFGITMGDADLLPENFASVNAICAYLRARGARERRLRAWAITAYHETHSSSTPLTGSTSCMTGRST